MEGSCEQTGLILVWWAMGRVYIYIYINSVSPGQGEGLTENWDVYLKL